MQITTKHILNVLLVLAWIIFVGLCIQAGGILFHAFFTLNLSMENSSHLWQEIDLTSLHRYDASHFFAMEFLIGIVSIMKAMLFYFIINILHEKKLNMSQPFNKEAAIFISRISYLALLIGVFSWSGINFSSWLKTKGVQMPDAEQLQVGGADVWLFMAVILFVIAQIFRKGIEIQSENELTV